VDITDAVTAWREVLSSPEQDYSWVTFSFPENLFANTLEVHRSVRGGITEMFKKCALALIALANVSLLVESALVKTDAWMRKFLQHYMGGFISLIVFIVDDGSLWPIFLRLSGRS